MIIDINATIGHYPFRQLLATNAEQMIGLMDEWTIDLAVVSSLHAAFYRDAHRGNTELFEQTKPHGNRFACVATVNPKYAGWRRDLEDSIGTGQVCAATLLPTYHGYDLTDAIAEEALKEIDRLELPLVLTQRLEDRRQRHHWDIAEDLTQTIVLELAKRYPQLKLVLSNWIGLDGAKLKAAGLAGRVLIDLARLHVLLNKDVPRLIETLGIEAIAFGSHMPFDYTAASLVKLANLDSLSNEDQQRVAWRNANEFFRLKIK